MNLDNESKAQERAARGEMKMLAMRLEVEMLRIIRKPTMEDVIRFQQLIQYAPREMKERVARHLDQVPEEEDG